MKWINRKFICNLTRKYSLFFVLYLTTISLSSAQSGLPVVTLRFENPVFDAVAKEYCLDIEFQSSKENIRLYGLNVRCFYEKDVIDFVTFTDFAPGYQSINPDPPLKRSLVQGSGSLFGFKNDAVYINGAVQLTNPNATPVFITPGQWTKIFSMCFHVSDPKYIPRSEFKPQIVWDLEENPVNGGFIPGSEGVVITVLRGDSNMTATPVLEKAIHLNWEYH